MHYAISATWGPTDTTRASLPFIFAASALQAGDTIMIMLFHDAVTIAVDGAYQKWCPLVLHHDLKKCFQTLMLRLLFVSLVQKRVVFQQICCLLIARSEA